MPGSGAVGEMKRSVRAVLLVMGGGNMGSALVRGLLGSGRDPGSMVVVEADEARRAALSEELHGVEVRAAAIGSEGAVLAVKPSDAQRACASLATAGTPRLLSIVAGLPTGRIESWLDPFAAVVRAMPNTPALVGEAASALSPGSRASEQDLAWAEEILGAVGSTVRVSEDALDAVTALSGSGPAYLFYVAESLIEAGVSAGLPAETAERLVLQTFAGSAKMLLEAGEPPETLRDRVTSPGGTTEAGLAVLFRYEVGRAIADAVAAAAARSRELGR
jgi:pyrroline-5-carboxylate reductase